MNKSLLKVTCIAAFSPVLAYASNNPILDHLASSEGKFSAMSTLEMKEARGAALIVGQPTPSVTRGLKKHMVTWKKFGSKADYKSYNYIGNTYQPASFNAYTFSYNGGSYYVAGDQWLADDISSPSSWSLANTYLKEYHYQVLNPSTGAPTAYAFRETTWNRPISKFNW